MAQHQGPLQMLTGGRGSVPSTHIMPLTTTTQQYSLKDKAVAHTQDLHKIKTAPKPRVVREEPIEWTLQHTPWCVWKQCHPGCDSYSSGEHCQKHTNFIMHLIQNEYLGFENSENLLRLIFFFFCYLSHAVKRPHTG